MSSSFRNGAPKIMHRTSSWDRIYLLGPADVSPPSPHSLKRRKPRVNLIGRYAQLSVLDFETKKTALLFSIGFVIVNLSGCESLSVGPAPMTSGIIRTGARLHAAEETLRDGRALFVSRCIECHTLPIITRYDAAAWPWLVNDMSTRASLKPAEREAVVAYL